MALALLDLLDQDSEGLRFRIDTGTNVFYQLKFGTSVGRQAGIDLVEDVYFTTPLSRGQSGSSSFDSTREVLVPSSALSQRNSYAQLFTFKNPSGRSPALSRPLRLAQVIVPPRLEPDSMPAAFSMTQPSQSYAQPSASLSAARRISHREASLARQASLDDLLGTILRVAGPLVNNLLQQSAPSTASATTPSTASDPIALIGSLLRSLVGPLSGSLSTTGARASAMSVAENRFAKPMIFGIDDALIGAAIGQVIQVLPALANAANQRRIALKQADNNLTAGILSDINRRLTMDRLAELMRPGAAPSDVSPEQAAQLLTLLSQLPAAPTANPAAAAVAAAPVTASTTQSLRVTSGARAQRTSFAMSNRAALSFELAAPQRWNGREVPLFKRGVQIVLNLRLVVGEPAPKAPLPKALLTLVLKDSASSEVSFEKVYRLKNVFAGQLLACPLEPSELAHLPANRPIAAVAQLRWLNARGVECGALGSTDIVFVDSFHVTDLGRDLNEELELHDMQLYRPFWNKVWEAPVLDGRADPNGRKKYMWELDVALRYSVLLSATQASNGAMESKLLKAPDDPDSLTACVQGRMKSGIELSVQELNKLLPQWNQAASLDAARLEAFQSQELIRNNAFEVIHAIRLNGKDRQRGLVWVVPVLKLRAFELAATVAADSCGQVLQTRLESVSFPMPWAVRVLGLVGGAEGADEDEQDDVSSTDYNFPGFEIVINDKVVLTAPGQGSQ